MLSKTFVCNINHCNKNSARYDNTGRNVKYTLLLSEFNKTWILLTDFLKN
jgi:hypothetical protein